MVRLCLIKPNSTVNISKTLRQFSLRDETRVSMRDQRYEPRCKRSCVVPGRLSSVTNFVLLLCCSESSEVLQSRQKLCRPMGRQFVGGDSDISECYCPLRASLSYVCGFSPMPLAWESNNSSWMTLLRNQRLRGCFLVMQLLHLYSNRGRSLINIFC